MNKPSSVITSVNCIIIYNRINRCQKTQTKPTNCNNSMYQFYCMM